MNALPLFDICENRHRGAPASVEANRRVDKADGRRRVIEFARSVGSFTLKDLAAHLGVTPNMISGRISELKRDRQLVETGARRDGCAVLKLAGVR